MIIQHYRFIISHSSSVIAPADFRRAQSLVAMALNGRKESVSHGSLTREISEGRNEKLCVGFSVYSFAYM